MLGQELDRRAARLEHLGGERVLVEGEDRDLLVLVSELEQCIGGARVGEAEFVDPRPQCLELGLAPRRNSRVEPAPVAALDLGPFGRRVVRVAAGLAVDLRLGVQPVDRGELGGGVRRDLLAKLARTAGPRT